MTTYDVTVLGGGPAGSATALALRRLGVERVLVAEASRFGSVRIGESVPPDTALLLRQLGVWDAFRAEGHERCLGSSSAWGSDDLGYNDFLFNPQGHGWHLDRRRFDAFLARRAEEAGAELRTATRFVDGAGDGRSGFDLRLQSRDRGLEKVRSRAVVDATGIGARLARRLGARRIFHDRLVCAVAFYELGPGSRFSRLTLLEAVEDGWWYGARLPDSRLALAFASDSETVKHHGANREEGWSECLQRTRHLRPRLDGARLLEGTLRIHVAASSTLDRVAGDGWVAVGDAATTYDPISSQGVYKALRDGPSAAAVVAAWVSEPAAGQRTYLAADYERTKGRDFAVYLSLRNHLYDLERRWPESPFWRRRRSASNSPDGSGRPLVAAVGNTPPGRPTTA